MYRNLISRLFAALYTGILAISIVMNGGFSMTAEAQIAPPLKDQRASSKPKTLDDRRTFPKISTLQEWEARREQIRQQILVSTGIYPLPPRTPLQPKITDRVERDGYSIEKVAIQTYPGFYLAGNLYRPLQTKGKRPGILVAHGHWNEGRMANNPDGSISARAITFARMGCVAFTYDMVGYNDTRQIVQHRQYANDPRAWLWGISLMGLQTWNSIRALDFLISLPEVDNKRLAITGESGGGTQTMILGAVDDRLTAVAPCVMVSHSMQGGCLCENAPGLRVNYSNMEISAAAAPRPQIIVGASGDWTSTTMTIEGPGVESIYRLYGKQGALKYVLFNYGHNINKTSREAVYNHFGHWLLGQNADAVFTEPPYQMEPVEKLRVFPQNTPLPTDAKNQDQLIAWLKEQGKADLESRKPKSKPGLATFKKTYLPAWTHTFLVEQPDGATLLRRRVKTENRTGYTETHYFIGRSEAGDTVPVKILAPASGKDKAILLVHPNGSVAFQAADGTAMGIAKRLLDKGYTVVLPDLFLTGERADDAVDKARQIPFGQFFSTYNRTDLQERVQDILTVAAFIRSQGNTKQVMALGQQQAGLWAMFASPGLNGVVADCVKLDLSNDDALLTHAMYVPGLRKLGDFYTATTLSAPNPLLLHNTGDKFTAATGIRETYQKVGAATVFEMQAQPVSDDAIIAWLDKLNAMEMKAKQEKKK